MKKITIIFVMCSITNVNAGMYKCVSGDKVSYQSSPCPNEEDENEFSLKYEISKEQIQAARDKKAAELAAKNEKKRLDKLAYDRERMIRAEEEKAREAALQTDALIERNDIEREKRINEERMIRAEEYKVRDAIFRTDAMIERNHIERDKRNVLERIESKMVNRPRIDAVTDGKVKQSDQKSRVFGRSMSD